MLLSVNAQVSLLLTTRFSDRDDADVLTAKQWGMLCTCLGGVEKLAELLDGRHEERLRECGITSELSEKVSRLLIIALRWRFLSTCQGLGWMRT